MGQVPAPREPQGSLVPARLEWSPPIREEPTIRELWGILRRNWWIILAAVVLFAGGAAYLTSRATPVYQSATSIRIGEKQSIPDLLLPLSTGSEVPTEMDVLSSRTLAEDAVTGLALQLQLLEPTRMSRADLLGDIAVDPEVESGVYVLTRERNGRFVVSVEDEDAVIATVAPGNTVRFGGVRFRLSPKAAEHQHIRLGVESFAAAVSRVRAGVTVSRPGRETKIITLTYESSDRSLTPEVPNLMAERFVTRREAAQKSAAGSTIEFLRGQLDTIAQQLRSAESELLTYRERERVVNPEVEGSSQVTRMVQLQNERSVLEAERSALSKLLAEVDATAARQGPDEPSAYRNLLAFPTLLRNQAATRLFENLTTVDAQRAELLARRMPEDPDVKVLTARIKDVERDLRSMAVSYLQGLTLQVAGLDSALKTFGRQLQQVPDRELQYTRLVRQPKLLEELFALLQTRLKEAQIAQAANDLSIQVVDPAVRPRRPIRPRAALNLFLGVMLGTLVGTGAGFLREMMDKAVHSRADVLTATGLPVIGLIPRIPRGRARVALISQKSAPRSAAHPAPTPPSHRQPEVEPTYVPPAAARPRYTFLGQVQEPNNIAPPPAVAANGNHSAKLPASPPSPTLAGARRVVLSEMGTGAVEAYSSLLTNLSYSLPDAPPKVIALTSALPGEGKTTNAANLAIGLAHRGAKVLLVDADLRRGIIHHLFEAPRDPGLTNVLWGQMSFEYARRTVQVGDHSQFDYLTTGALPPNPTSMVESATMRLLLERWREEYDSVIIDTPPVNIITDAALLGARVDGVVLVARAGVTHAGALGYALEQLKRVQAPVLGVLLSDIDFTRDAAYDPSYRYQRYDQYTTAKS
jgi:capsular exopolysaccharide synthesis family protein